MTLVTVLSPYYRAGVRLRLSRANQCTRLGVGARLRRNAFGDYGALTTPLLKWCHQAVADVSKLMYHTRINGDLLDHDLLVSFDGQTARLRQHLPLQ